MKLNNKIVTSIALFGLAFSARSLQGMSYIQRAISGIKTTLNSYVYHTAIQNPVLPQEEPEFKLLAKKTFIDPQSKQEGTLVILANHTFDTQTYKQYQALIFPPNSLFPAGFCKFEEYVSSPENTKKGYIALLEIFSDVRKSGYGPLLLGYAKEHLFQSGCQEITLVASPFDLQDNQTYDEMYPKLVAFYERQGGIKDANPNSCRITFRPPSHLEPTPASGSVYNDQRLLMQEDCIFGKDNVAATASAWKCLELDRDGLNRYTLYLHRYEAKISSCKIDYDPATKTAYCSNLWVCQTQRSSGAGFCMAAFCAKFIASLNGKRIWWHVKPFDLDANQTEEMMMPKLIKFYESLGGVYYKDLELMMIDISGEQNTFVEPEARNHAAVITNHIAPAAQADTVTATKAMGRINNLLNHIQ